MNAISLEYCRLGPIKVPRLFNGLWQLSSDAWGLTSPDRIKDEMRRYVENGLYAFDMADQYGPAEALFGKFKSSYFDSSPIIGATKWCVFENIEPTRAAVEDVVRARLSQMKVEKIDLLQTDWNDYTGNYIPAYQHLKDLQSEGLITALGLCNMDSQRTDEICTALGEGTIVSNQVQFSLIDVRPRFAMADMCRKHNLKLLTYGTLCGGFLSDKYLGISEPDYNDKSLTPSQRKYLDVITSTWGGWSLFQKLLQVCRTIGDRHEDASISNVATRWVLDHEYVAAVLIGTRLGVSDHIEDSHKVFKLQLNEQDKRDIDAILAQSQGSEMITIIGDCGAEYRRRMSGVKYFSPKGHA